MNPTSFETDVNAAWDRYAEQEFNLWSPASWGCHVSRQIPEARWVGSFVWFASWSDMVTFAVEVFPAIGSHTDTDLAVRSLHQTLHHHLSEVSPEQDASEESLANLEPVRMALNADLGNHLRVDWWGTAESLQHSDHPFARTMRSWFRHGADGMLAELAERLEMEPPEVPDSGQRLDPAVAERPIEPEEAELFCDAIAQSGD